jgi:hypothetical protein
MAGRSGVYMRCTRFDNEEIVLFYRASSFSDIVPAFSFVAVNQNVLRASFCTFPVVTFGVRIVASCSTTTSTPTTVPRRSQETGAMLLPKN